ncbi:hypothetical protein ABZV77_13590 [Streptomyces sp. NPDC004732]|uniref:hypothetical protein n=1 Tax=Streptomyces sp. NPDC004732 TaxID=3154290 RepID=UPI0033BE3D10
MSAPVANFWGDLDPNNRVEFPEAKRPDETWELSDGGSAWVYRAPGRSNIRRPVILSDGFSSLPSSYNELYYGLEGAGSPDYKFISALHERGYDLVLLGYEDRTRSIIDNAKVATECILNAIARQEGDARLTLGNFSLVAGLLQLLGAPATAHHEATCFVPSGSAVDLLDFDLATPEADPFADLRKVPEEKGGLHSFLLSETSTPHTSMTQQLGEWIVDQLAD